MWTLLEAEVLGLKKHVQSIKIGRAMIAESQMKKHKGINNFVQ